MQTEHIAVQGNVSEKSFQEKITEGVFAFALTFTHSGFSSFEILSAFLWHYLFVKL